MGPAMFEGSPSRSALSSSPASVSLFTSWRSLRRSSKYRIMFTFTPSVRSTGPPAFSRRRLESTSRGQMAEDVPVPLGRHRRYFKAEAGTEQRVAHLDEESQR